MESAPQSAVLLPEPQAGPASTRLAAIAGLLSALITADGLFPQTRGNWSLSAALIMAAVWLAATACSGAATSALTLLLLNRSGLWRSGRWALDGAVPWTLLPPLLFLLVRHSYWALLVTAWAAAALALCIRDLHLPRPAMPLITAPQPFGGLPPPDTRLSSFLCIAACIEGAGVCLLRRDLLPAVLLLAPGVFVLTDKAVVSGLRSRRPNRAAARLAIATMFALLILVPFLLARPVQAGPSGDGAGPSNSEVAGRRSAGVEGYQGIILWPVVPKKQVILPTLVRHDPAESGAVRLLVIPFDGAYWYFQAPHHSPGLHAHFAHGSPVAISIYSLNWISLVMQAHQSLIHPVSLANCGRFRVGTENGDNRPGRIDLAVLLTDSSAPGKPSSYLGVQPIPSTEPNAFFVKSNPIDEELDFPISAHSTIRKFDQITVFFFPSEQRATFAARIGIRQFELVPR